MKNVFKGFILLLTLACFSCQDEADINNTTEKIAVADGDLAIIKSLGFDIEKVIDYGDYYLVEDDITLEKDNLSKYLNREDTQDSTPKLRQAYTGNLISVTNVKNITVGFDSSLPVDSEWRTVTLNALNEWNSIPGSSVKFVYVTASNPDIKIYQDYSNDNRIANADFPASGKSGKYVKINLKHNNLGTTFKLQAIVHELGHTLGLRHTDWHNRPDGGKESNATTIPGTPTVDSWSLMNSINTYWSGFSYYDVIGIQYLYPDPSPITASTSLIGINENVTYTIPNYLGNVTWSATSNATLVSGQGTSSATFKGTGNGYTSIKAEVPFYGNTFTFTSNAVWAGAPMPSISADQPKLNFSSKHTLYCDDAPGSTSFTWTLMGNAAFENGSRSITTSVNHVIIKTLANDDLGMGQLLRVTCTATNKYGSGTGRTNLMFKL